jgi:hypothetical protein
MGLVPGSQIDNHSEVDTRAEVRHSEVQSRAN